MRFRTAHLCYSYPAAMAEIEMNKSMKEKVLLKVCIDGQHFGPDCSSVQMYVCVTFITNLLI